MTERKSAAEWVCLHWIEWWFTHRHTGTPGHAPDACRRHARSWLAIHREEYGA